MPLSPTTVLYLFGKLLISSLRPAFLADISTEFIDALGSPNLRFSEIVDVNKNASCGTIARFFLKFLRSIFLYQKCQ